MTAAVTIREQREALAAQVRQVAETAKSENRNLTADEQQQIGADLTKVKAFDDQIRAGEATQDLVRQIAALPDVAKAAQRNDSGEVKAGSLGEHFVKSGAYEEMREKRSVTRFTAGSSEFVLGKAEPPPTLSTGLGQVQYGPVVPTALQRPTIADLLSSGTLNGVSLTYFQQGITSGDFGAVAENTEKPGITFSFDPVTEPLAKIAGVTKITDETTEDAAAVVSIIDSQLRLRLAIQEEHQISAGSGTAPNLRGILNRAGVQTVTATDSSDNLDAIYRGMTACQTATQLTATGIVIHPTDYQNLRLGKDTNGQYYGGGPFQGPYGNGGLVLVPPIWGLPTVVTTGIAQGTALVGAFAAAAQLFRRGGVRVESTNSDGDDFRFNRIAIRAEERILLAVYIPAAFVKIVLSSTPPTP
jgi:HK97 family phage major capsid protein